jgi:hypothetical protein
MEPELFNEKFPKLHSLKLYDVLNNLPPPDSKLSFPQFKTLEITNKWHNWGIYPKSEYENWVKWLAKLFPNVHNPWINKAQEAEDF